MEIDLAEPGGERCSLPGQTPVRPPIWDISQLTITLVLTSLSTSIVVTRACRHAATAPQRPTFNRR